jgi:tetratricopeptide (TPR) repeat protein
MTQAPNDPERWRRLSALFEQAVDLQDDARDAFLRALPDSDAALIPELRAMLAADDADAALDERVSVPAGVQAPLPPHAVGTVLGAWKLDGILGQGGMGVVHAAHRVDDFEQRAAVKCLQQRWDGRLQAGRFLRERNILAGLSHPNIARLLDAGIDAHGQPWFAMERIDGLPIDADADQRRLDLRARVRLLLRVCAAVQHAHERFVVHRDLKPDNLLVDGDGNPKVLDFGVAKLLEADAGQATRTGLPAAFTPDYAAPEQLDGREITAATDVHALGLVLYRLLTGGMPYALDGRSLPERIAAISGQAPMRLEQALATGDANTIDKRLRDRSTDAGSFHRFVGGDLTRILQTALAKEPQRRYATVQAFAADLERFLDGRPVSVSGDTRAYRVRKFVQRNPWGSAFAAMLFATAIGFGVYATVTANRIARQAEQVAAERDRAQAIADFLGKLLAQADPTRADSDLTASQMLERGTTLVDQDESLGIAERAAVLTAIGGVYQVKGDYPRALPALQRAVALGREAGAPDLAFASSLLELSKVHTRLGQLPDAEARAREAVALLERLAAGDAEHASGLSQLAVVLSEQERLPEATALLERVVALRSTLPDAATDQNLAANYNNLALNLVELGRPAEAEAAYDAALAILERKFGPEHPYGAFLRGSRAELHEQRGDAARAREDLERALVIASKALGEEHPFVADVSDRLGRMAIKRGDTAVARKHLELALRIQQDTLPAGHADITRTREALASLDATP